jgi:RNA polymerase sigma-70 factor (ECF subfamily)
MLFATSAEPPSERAALARSSRDAVFRSLYDAHFTFVWRCLRRLGVPESSCDDALQDVFVAVHSGLSSFRAGSSARTWIYGIALHVALKHRRRFARKEGEGNADSLTENSEAMEDQQPDPHEVAERAEAMRVVMDLVSNMDESRREIFLLAEIEQLTAPEIASIASIPLNTVYSRLRLARQDFDAAVARYQRRGR